MRQVLAVFLLLCAVLPNLGDTRADAQSGNSDKSGNLVVLVTLDDVYRTPPKDIYIEAHSFNVNWVSEKLSN